MRRVSPIAEAIVREGSLWTYLRVGAVGSIVGRGVGCSVGSRVGAGVGEVVGRGVGASVGTRLGEREGRAVGDRVYTTPNTCVVRLLIL
jgi:hypothetical protein